MTVQTATPPPSAGEFLQAQAAQAGAATPGGGAAASHGGTPDRSAFGKVFQAAERAGAGAGGASLRDMARAARGMSDAELAKLVVPVVRGSEDLMDIAEALGVEVEEGNIAEAIGIARDVAERASSRFDPDLILGADADATDRLALLRALLKRFEEARGGDAPNEETAEEAEDAAATPPEPPVDPALPAVPPAQAAELPQDGPPDDTVEAALPPETAEEGATSPAEIPLDASAADEKIDVDALPPETPEAVGATDKTSTQAAQAERRGRFADLLAMRAVGATEEAAAASAANPPVRQRGAEDASQREAAVAPAATGVSQDDAPAAAEKQNAAGQENAGSERIGASARTVSRPAATAPLAAERDTDAVASSARDTRAETSFVDALAQSVASGPDGARDPMALSTTPRPLPVSYPLNAENPFGDGVLRTLEIMRGESVSEARMIVDPPALGRIDVSLQATANGVEASFRVDNEGLKQMLQQQIDVLKESLQAQGIHVAGLTVDIREREDRGGRGDLYGTKGKGRRIGGVEAADGEMPEAASVSRIDLERGLLNWVA